MTRKNPVSKFLLIRAHDYIRKLQGLELNKEDDSGPYLEKQMQYVISNIDDLLQKK